MSERHVYSTSLHWSEQRKGTLASGQLPGIAVATPPEFPGGHAGIWSPEHLYTAAAEVCLMTTFLAIAENSKLPFFSYSSTAEGLLEKTAEGYRMTEILIRPRVTVPGPDLVERAVRILEKAEKACLISNSMKTLVRSEPEVESAAG
jgi:organic hydroperoxide reductase OsmC/OhrA